MANRVAAPAVQWITGRAVRTRASLGDWWRRHKLWILTWVFLGLLLGISGIASIELYLLLAERAKEIRRELFQRDLRDLVGRFDADERFVIENNLSDMLQERRALKPLLLPRQYYQALPATSATVLPRQPPRNCFVQLERQGQVASPSDRGGDRLCTYFAENKAFGRYLFLAATLQEDQVVPLKSGDITLAADAIRVEVSAYGQTQAWWLTYQVPPTAVRSDRFELTAFREVGPGQRDRDRRIEGWAYVQRQAKGSRVYVIARLDFREFLPPDEDDQTWPPANWRNTTLAVERRDVWSAPTRQEAVRYQPMGLGELSLATLGTPIFSAYGSLTIESMSAGTPKSWPVVPPPAMRERSEPGLFGVKLAKGDLLLPAKPTSHSEALPDTDLVLTVSHPWTLVERGFWLVAVLLSILFPGGLFATLFFHKRLLQPISEWARYSERLAQVRRDIDVALPYAERKDEVGVLATAINALIRSVREQTARAQREREMRATEERRKLMEELEERQQNIAIFGHEIRSPLMSLLARHQDPDDSSKRYIERMLAALPHLLGGTSSMDAIDARELTMEEFDLSNFLVEVAVNAEDADIPGVVYEGTAQGVRVRADVGAVEDALTHILNNANRHRTPGSAIRIVLHTRDESARVEVWNDGDTIPEENLEAIFSFGFSTAAKSSDQGLGAGLHVARTYIRRMGGALEVANHTQGVVFTIVLPISIDLLG